MNIKILLHQSSAHMAVTDPHMSSIGLNTQVTYKDDHSGYRFVFFLKDRKQILDTFKSMYKLAKHETSHAMVRSRSDNGQEYLSNAFQEYLRNRVACITIHGLTPLQEWSCTRHYLISRIWKSLV